MQRVVLTLLREHTVTFEEIEDGRPRRGRRREIELPCSAWRMIEIGRITHGQHVDAKADGDASLSERVKHALSSPILSVFYTPRPAASPRLHRQFAQVPVFGFLFLSTSSTLVRAYASAFAMLHWFAYTHAAALFNTNFD
jgi:hypothetical protein